MSEVVVATQTAEILIETRSADPIAVTLTQASVAVEMFSGPPGPPSAAASYTHTQASASDTWTVNHNLGVKPHVAVLSPGGVEVEASVVHVSTNQCVIQFAAPYVGSARCL